MSAKDEVKRILRRDAVRPSGGCLPVLLWLLVGLLLWPPGAAADAPLTAAHGPRGNESRAVRSQSQATEVSPQANAQAGVTDTTNPPPNSIKLISGPNVFQCEDGDGMCTAFLYALTAGGPPQPSHVMLAACTARLVRVEGWQPVETGLDPTTGVVGIKLDNLNFAPGEILTFSLVMRGTFTAQPVTWTIKAGQQIVSGRTWGPQCSPTAVALAGFAAAPADDRPGYAALLLLLGYAGMLARVRRRWSRGK